MASKTAMAKMKQRGLKRLRFYCQPCEKQCPDANGFKCHCLSVSHLRQVELFAQSGEELLDQYSNQMVETFLSVLSRQGGRLVKANAVYQEIISDRSHVHMTATKFDSLSSLVAYLGKTARCKVQADEQGVLWVQHIDNASIERERIRNLEAERAVAKTLNQDELERLRVEALAKAATDKLKQQSTSITSDGSISHTPNQSTRQADDQSTSHPNNEAAPPQPVTLALPSTHKLVAPLPIDDSVNQSLAQPVASKRKISALDAIMVEELANKKAKNDMLNKAAAEQATSQQLNQSINQPVSSLASEQSWLFVGLVVKIMNQSLASGRYYRTKGEIVSLVDQYTAEIVVANNQSINQSVKIRIDQSELETVIPALGSPLMIVAGTRRGTIGRLVRLTDDQSAAVVECQGKLIELQFEEVCKYVK